jgi:hypothetical protein
VFDEDGEGPAPPKLFAGGFFSSAGGTACANIARLDAGGWTALAAGIGGTVDALAIFDPDGAGPRTPALHAGGDFTSAGGLTTSGIAYWDGLVWHAQESGTDGDVLAIAPFDSDGPSGLDPPVLYVGGDFQLAGGASASRAALWTGCAPESLCYADCTADLLLSIADFGCFQTRFVSGELYADCNADGLLTVADFGCFQTRFLAGCP